MQTSLTWPCMDHIFIGVYSAGRTELTIYNNFAQDITNALFLFIFFI